MRIGSHYCYAFGIRISVIVGKKEVAHAYVYIMNNNQHQHPFGLLEDLYVVETKRQKGYGKMLVKKIIAEAKKYGCYKLIATSRSARPKVHKFYEDLGFKDYGKEFRLEI